MESPEHNILETDRGDWFCTRSGKRFHVLSPSADELDIESICWSLSNLCRFGGHCNFYSVGQHSCLVSDQLPQHLKLCGLLHDFTEAYYMDLPKPLKRSISGYCELEDALWVIGADKWGLPYKMPYEVKTADCRMLLTERDQLMPECANTADWYLDSEFDPYEIKIIPWIPAQTRAQFMARYELLTK